MGYTHYWKNESRPTAEQWGQASAAIIQLLLATKIEIETSEISNGSIRIEGSYETFFVTPDRTIFAFCKTNREPYDALVVASLMILERYLPGFSWRSDGDDEPNYKDAAIKELTNAGVEL